MSDALRILETAYRADGRDLLTTAIQLARQCAELEASTEQFARAQRYLELHRIGRPGVDVCDALIAECERLREGNRNAARAHLAECDRLRAQMEAERNARIGEQVSASLRADFPPKGRKYVIIADEILEELTGPGSPPVTLSASPVIGEPNHYALTCERHRCSPMVPA